MNYCLKHECGFLGCLPAGNGQGGVGIDQRLIAGDFPTPWVNA